MAPRRLKTVLKATAPARLAGKGARRGFEVVRQGQRTGQRLRGLTKALTKAIWSDGALPSCALYGEVRRGGWKGRGGGRRRGAAVDAQVSRAVNSGKIKPACGQYTLTKLTLAALAEHGLEPVACQRAVCSLRRRIGTAIDVLCYERSSARLIVVELKCGHSGGKTAPAQRDGAACAMRVPLTKACDSTLHRHMAQLACTRELFAREAGTLKQLAAIGINPDVGGALLYVDDAATELYTLSDWWISKAGRILAAL